MDCRLPVDRCRLRLTARSPLGHVQVQLPMIGSNGLPLPTGPASGSQSIHTAHRPQLQQCQLLLKLSLRSCAVCKEVGVHGSLLTRTYSYISWQPALRNVAFVLGSSTVNLQTLLTEGSPTKSLSTRGSDDCLPSRALKHQMALSLLAVELILVLCSNWAQVVPPIQLEQNFILVDIQCIHDFL
jgi:hypothetical protein